MRLAAALLLLTASAARGQDTPPEYDWIVTFENGDTVHCQLHSLENRKLEVVWAIAPDKSVALDLKAIGRLSRAQELQPAPPAGQPEIMRLHDGSVLYGRAVRFGTDVILFEVDQVGRLTVGNDAVATLTRGTVKLQGTDAKPGEYTILTRSGDVVTGQLKHDDKNQLVLTGQELTATIDYASVAAIVFPAPRDDAQADTPEKADETALAIQVALRNGSRLAGRHPALKQGTLSFRLESGQQVAIPMTEVAAIAFSDFDGLSGRIGARAILVWGAFADPADEYKKTLAVLRTNLRDRWKIEETHTKKFDRDFRRALFRARTLLIPEMERLRQPYPANLAKDFRTVSRDFLRSGGNIVILGAQNNHVAWLKEANLFDVRVLGTVDGHIISFSPDGAKIGKGLSGPWRAVNATFAYVPGGAIPATTLAQTGGKSVILGRRVGRGWLLLVGTDYYQTNDQASRVLINAITLR